MAINVRRAAERAHPAFVANDWMWWHTDGAPPSVDQIEDTINFLIDSMEYQIIKDPPKPGDHLFTETGRLGVRYDVFEDDERMSVSLKLGTDLDDVITLPPDITPDNTMLSTVLTFNDEARTAVATLSSAGRDHLATAIKNHEDELDCSNGPVVAVAVDAVLLRDAEYTCCGWEETFITIDGLALVIGSCYGH